MFGDEVALYLKNRFDGQTIIKSTFLEIINEINESLQKFGADIKIISEIGANQDAFRVIALDKDVHITINDIEQQMGLSAMSASASRNAIKNHLEILIAKRMGMRS